LFVFAAPSGAGKTTLVNALVTKHPELRFSISYTTRPQRSNEADGVDYLFIGEAAFSDLLERDALLESATVFDNLYGTSREQVEQHLRDNHDVILEIDWQGARQVRESMPECVTIFILPPSLDSSDVIDRRLQDAISDMSHWDEFDYVVVNDDLDKAIGSLEAILDGRGQSLATGDAALRATIAAIVS